MQNAKSAIQNDFVFDLLAKKRNLKVRLALNFVGIFKNRGTFFGHSIVVDDCQVRSYLSMPTDQHQCLVV